MHSHPNPPPDLLTNHQLQWREREGELDVLVLLQLLRRTVLPLVDGPLRKVEEVMVAAAVEAAALLLLLLGARSILASRRSSLSWI